MGMHLPLSRAVAPRLDFLAETGSTNAELVSSGSVDPTHFRAVATTTQTAGRGRLDRAWVAPPGRALAVSVLVTPDLSRIERLGWLPLLAGLAMTRAVASLVPPGVGVALKWPNDVLVGERKVSGLLAELIPGVGVVIGAGLNLTMTAEELPTPTSTSLTLAGVSDADLVDVSLSRYLAELRSLYDGFAAAGFDAEASGLRSAVTGECATLGRRVRVELPGAPDLIGTATGLDGSGRLVVAPAEGHRVEGPGAEGPGAERPRAVAAGDVTHLRYA